jgi:hypothetical protein
LTPLLGFGASRTIVPGVNYVGAQGRAEELGVGDRLHWLGMVSGELKWGAFHAAELFCLTSHQENFGIAVGKRGRALFAQRFEIGAASRDLRYLLVTLIDGSA